MPSVKKTRPISFEVIDKSKAIAALLIQSNLEVIEKGRADSGTLSELELKKRIDEFERTYHHSYLAVIKDLWKWYLYIFTEKRSYYSEEIYNRYIDCISRVNKEPLIMLEFGNGKLTSYEWVFNGFVYEVNGFYSDDQIRLLILEDFDKERAYFEKLNAKFNQTANPNTTYERPRIPENIRIEVWRRDGGKCARCGSREKLEYDHIVPISKGGSNTARNIELLCERCNRSKSNNVV